MKTYKPFPNLLAAALILSSGLFANVATATPEGNNSQGQVEINSELPAVEAKHVFTRSNDIISVFLKPDVDAKTMARIWFPDAGAGASEEGLALVEKTIRGMAEGGMGGVEVAYLSAESDFTNEDAKEVGWGSENWKKVLKKVLETANSIEDGFKVDITLTAHWPPVVNNVDPNDDEAAQEASYAYTKITQADINAGVMDLPLPEQKKLDHFIKTFSSGDKDKANFLFVDKFVAATVAEVSGFDQTGNPIFKVASMTDVTGSTSKKLNAQSANGYAGYAAGVPDKAYCAANGLDYQTDVIDVFGPEPSNTCDGKLDAENNRKRMADWQYLYQIDLDAAVSGLTASPGDELAVGDCVIIGSYHRGTGQVLSGGAAIPTYNRCYATDYYTTEAVDKIIEFWDENILDEEMISLMRENGKKNGTSIFEDSIEMTSEGAIWPYDLLEEFHKLNGYDATKYTPILTMQNASFDDAEIVSKIQADYSSTKNYLYVYDHGAKIKDWARTLNYTYRAQTGSNDEAAIAVDVPEGDNGTSASGVRGFSMASNIGGGKFVSMEATTFSANINSKWGDIMKVLNGDFSHGINRVILHGAPFARTFNGYLCQWPGWNFFKHMSVEGLNGSGFSSWTSRQIWWEDANIPTGYIGRTQAVLQNGKASVDLLVVGGGGSPMGMMGMGMSGSSITDDILAKGYSYNSMESSTLLLDNVEVVDGVLAPEEAAYKALVITGGADSFADDVLAKVLKFAQQGYTIAFSKSDVASAANSTLKEILSGKYASVGTYTDVSDLDQFLCKHNAAPSASYDQEGLEVSHRVADEGDYYFYYNDYSPSSTAAGAPGGMPQGGGEMPEGGMPEGGGEMPQMGGEPGGAPAAPTGDTTPSFGGDDPFAEVQNDESEGFKEQDDVANSITTTVTMTGSGKPYILDAWDGSVTPVALYTEKDGKYTMDISLVGREAMIICIAENSPVFTEMADKYAVSTSGGEVVYNGNKLTHRAEFADEYKVVLSDNSEKTVKVKAVPAQQEISASWDVKLLSYGPSKESESITVENNYDYTVDPSSSVVTEVSFNDVELNTWSELPATKDQLTKLGVESMKKVSGIAYYSATFDLPSDWNGNIGAYMKIDHNSDMITKVLINGNDIGVVNPISDTADVQKYLKKGTNTIEIKLDSTLQNRDPSAVEKTEYGVSGITIIPYYESKL